jgi:hypothetical protein
MCTLSAQSGVKHPPPQHQERRKSCISRASFEYRHRAGSPLVLNRRADAADTQGAKCGPDRSEGTLLRVRENDAGEGQRHEAEISLPLARLTALQIEFPRFAADLRSGKLGELVEREATDSPDAVLTALEGRPLDEQRNVARLLAHRVHDVLRPERRNVMTALMALSERLGDEAQPVAREIADSLRAFRVANDLDPRHLPAALAIALVAEGRNSHLGLEVLHADELWTEHARFKRSCGWSTDLGLHS